MNMKTLDTKKIRLTKPLSDEMLTKVSGGSGNDPVPNIDCPVCGATVWFGARSDPPWECTCGWFSDIRVW